MSSNDTQEVFSGDTLAGPAYVERQIRWPGGKGLLSVQLTASGPSAKIVVGWVNRPPGFDAGNSGWNMMTPALSIGGVSSIAATGDYLVDLPACFIQFLVQLDPGDTITISQAMLVRF